MYLLFESLKEIGGFIYIIIHILWNSCFRKLDGVPRTKLRPNTVCHRPKRQPTRRNYTELEVSAEEELVFFVKTMTENILASVWFRR